MSQPPAQTLIQMASGYWVSQAIYVAAKLDIAGLLAGGPQSADSLAQATDTQAAPLYRLLRALASLGIFAEDQGRQFRLTPLADLMRDDHPESKRPMILMLGEEHYQAYGELLHSVRTGQTGFEKVYGQPVFDFLSSHPEQARLFDAAMVSFHGRETLAMVQAYDFSGIQKLCDVGGGNGSVLSTVLENNAHVQGILFDLPGVIERARPRIAAAGLASRCECVAGSFFDTAPAGADAYFMRHIIHDWYDDRCLAILKNIHRAAMPGAKLLVVETIIPPGNESGFAKLLDLTMLVLPGGMERTLEEYRDLLARGGFELVRVIPTTAEISILEAVRRE